MFKAGEGKGVMSDEVASVLGVASAAARIAGRSSNFSPIVWRDATASQCSLEDRQTSLMLS